MSSIDNRGENEFADEESNLVGKSEEYKEGEEEEEEDQTITKEPGQKQNPKDESNSG